MSHRVDYLATQNLLRELARSARREAVARKPDPPGLSPSLRWGTCITTAVTAGKWARRRRHSRAVLSRPSTGSSDAVPGGRLWPRSRSDPACGSRRSIGARHRHRLGARGGCDRLAAGCPKRRVRSRFFCTAGLVCLAAANPASAEASIWSSSTTASAPSNRSIAMTMWPRLPSFCVRGTARRSVLSPRLSGRTALASTAGEIQRRLQDAFSITYQETPTDSAITRAGLELLLVAERRASG